MSNQHHSTQRPSHAPLAGVVGTFVRSIERVMSGR